jgi:hypothetical protein
MKAIEKIVVASKHRPFNADDPNYKKFCREKLTEMEELSTLLPHIDWGNELEVFGK